MPTRSCSYMLWVTSGVGGELVAGTSWENHDDAPHKAIIAHMTHMSNDVGTVVFLQ